MRTAAAVFMALATVGVAGQTQRVEHEEVVKDRYTSPNGRTIELVGVCEVTSKEIQCWDPQGRHSQKLTDVANAIATSETLTLRFGKKNCWFLFQVDSGLQVMGPEASDGGLDGYLSSGSPHSRLSWWGDEATASTTVTIRLGGALSPIELKAPLIVDGRDEKMGKSIRVVTWGRVKNLPTEVSNSFFGGDAKKAKATPVWFIEIDEQAEGQYLNYLANDRSGQQIRHVDQIGRPVGGVEALAAADPPRLVPGRRPAATPPAGMQPPRFSVLRLDPRTRALYTTIDPAYIGSITSTLTRTVTVRFKDIPLRPAAEEGSDR